MSQPEEIKAHSTAAEVKATTGMEMEQAVAQLRTLVCGLGGAVLVLSVMFDAFVFKLIRNTQGETNIRARQVQQIESMQQRWSPALNELAVYSSKDQELAAIFKKHGVEVTLPAAQEATPPQP